MTVEASKPEADKRGRRRQAVGVVTSDKMNKTRRVEIPRLVKHARYGKYIRRRTICHVHDETNESHLGDFVEDQNVRPRFGSDGEPEASDHPGGQRLQGFVRVIEETGEVEHPVDARANLRPVATEQDTVVHDVLDDREVRIEPGSQLDQRCDIPLDANGSGRRLEDAGNHLERRRLPGPVRPDDADLLTAAHLE